MSVFYNAYFLKTEASAATIKEKFGRVDLLPESAWIVCNFDDGYADDVFDPGHYFTKEISRQFGEAIFICVDTSNDQFEYEHSRNGEILRKLCWLSDGSQSTWGWVEGEREEWEETAIFSEENFARAIELIRYDEHLAFLPEAEFLRKKQELRSIWEERRYVLNDKWPLGDATFGMVIQQFFGLKTPLA